MTEILTSNQVTPIHGILPTTERDASSIERGFVIYLEILGPTGGLFARTFWTKYGYQDGPANQREFVDEILKMAETDDMKDVKLDSGPFTKWNRHAFRDDISEIKFGWKPINVSYVLNSKFVKIQALDGANPLQQSLVFRRDKIVKGIKQEYLPNHSFFNLEFYSQEDATILEFSNFMLTDERATYIGDPPTDLGEMASKYFPYCLDIPMDFDQSKIFSQFFPQFLMAASNDATPDGGILNTITFVFDPPQGNGGGGGVPTQP